MLEFTSNGSCVAILDVPQTLLYVSATLDNPSPGASTLARISFTPTNVNNFNRIVITLTGFQGVSGQANLVSSFVGIDGSPSATAAITSDSVLTVLFTAGKLIAGRSVSFAVSNIQNPSSLFSSTLHVRAATYGAASATLLAYVGSTASIQPILVEDKHTLLLKGIPSAISAGVVDVRVVDVTIGTPMPSSDGINVATSQDCASSICRCIRPYFWKNSKPAVCDRIQGPHCFQLECCCCVLVFYGLRRSNRRKSPILPPLWFLSV